MEYLKKCHMNIKWSKDCFILDGKPIIILAGEIEYFRIKKKDWQDRLNKARSAGLNTVSFYIPWGWHEYEEGKYDFNGRAIPERDLESWLKLIADEGLYAFPRIGPYIYSEWVDGGVPTWLLDRYPDIQSTNMEINLDGALVAQKTRTISYLNDFYLKKVDEWYSRLSNLFKKHLFTKGGNIIFIQPDNEIGGVVPFDYSGHVIKKYRQWLEKRYKNINSLNIVHRTEYKDFNAVVPPSKNPDSYENLRVWLDWDRFRYYYYSLYAEKLTNILRGKGIDTPMVYNCPCEPTYHYDYADRLGKEGIAGLDHYPIADDNTKFNYSVLPKFIFNFCLMQEIIGDAPLFLPECQIGLWWDIPRVCPADLNLYYMSALAHGAKSFSFYQFAGGENPLRHGSITKSYDYQAPVAPDGALRPSYHMLENFISWLKLNSEILHTSKDYDAGLGFYLPYFAFFPPYPKGTDLGDTKKLGLRVNMRDALGQLFYEGLLKSIILAGLNIEIVDLEKVALARLKRYPQLWIFSLDFMARSIQKKLLEYARTGGKLILNPIVPYLDEEMRKCTILEDALTSKVVDIQTSGHVDLMEIKQIPATLILQKFKVGQKTKSLTTGNRNIHAFETRVGKGKITVLGFGINTYMREHEESIRKIMVKD